GEAAAHEGEDELLERALHQVGMVRFASPEDTVEGAVDRGRYAIVQLGGAAVVAALNRLHELGVAGWLRPRRARHRAQRGHRPEPGSGRGATRRHLAWRVPGPRRQQAAAATNQRIV